MQIVLMDKRTVNIIIFTISTDSGVLIETVNSFKNDYPILCLSTHCLFDDEMQKLSSCTNKDLIFKNFAHFLTAGEMLFCDLEADKVIFRRHGCRTGNIQEYFLEIKKMKNQTVLKNIHNDYVVKNGFLLSNDLGINQQCWMDAGVLSNVNQVDPDKKDIIPKKTFFSKYKNFRKLSVLKISYSSESFYILGKIGRLKQYLNKDVKFRKLGVLSELVLRLLIRVSTKKPSDGKYFLFLLVKYVSKFILFLINGAAPRVAVSSTIHSGCDEFGELAKLLKVPYYLFQDGFIPTNYSSQIYAYNGYVDTYFVWDKMSMKTIKNQGLTCRVSSFFNCEYLPYIPKETIEVENVLVLTSGAGDWTAIKNRSDEDYMFKEIINLAYRKPNIRFIYRPHPLWVHPNHQGRNSIMRLEKYVSRNSVRNVIISTGAIKESLQFSVDRNLSQHSISIDEEIERADLVIGDHSQAMINAARAKTIFASMNVTKRNSLFKGFNDLSFPHFKNSWQLEVFIDSLASSVEVITEYNLAVTRYNDQLHKN